MGNSNPFNPLPIVVRDLSYHYRRREAQALRDISFTAGQGEIILIAGASGSGKTTLLRCLNGLIPHSYDGGRLTGGVYIYGQEPASLKLSQLARLIGTVLQDPEKQIVASYVANEVAFGLENLNVPRAEMTRRIEAILAHLDILHLSDRETFHLSGGEKQKLTIAATLVLEPSILLLDEPLANLDPFSLKETLALIRRLAGEGKTILLIEHRLEDVFKIGPDKVLFLVDGQQRYFGDLDGFKAVADPQQVKLPAPLILKRLLERQLLEPRLPEAETGPVSRPLRLAVSQNGTEREKAPLARFENVYFWYEPERPILENISCTIRSGDVIAILGPNGAGKTTLVKHAIGLLKPRKGVVTIGGRDTTQLSVAQVAHSVGYVFQSPSHMLFAPSVQEEIAFGPRNLGFPEATIAANGAAALEMVDLADRTDDPPLSLSFGQQKRVTIASVVAMQSRILVMDEPTAGQDYRHYTHFMETILYQPEGTPWQGAFEAIIFITHDLDLAISYANRVILINNGRLEADGPPHQVLGDDERLARCRLTPTSLLEWNRKLLPKTGRFLRPNLLIPYVDPAELEEAIVAGKELKSVRH